MNILLDAYWDHNFGDDLFITRLTRTYPQHTFFSFIGGCAPHVQRWANHIPNLVILPWTQSVLDAGFFDAYIMIGGDVLPDGGDYTGSYARRKEYMRTVKEAGGWVGMLGFSLSDSYGMKTFLDIEQMVRYANDVAPRDHATFSYLTHCENSSCVRQGADLAFGWDCTQIRQLPSVPGNLGISVRRSLSADDSQYQQYVSAMAAVADAWLEKDADRQVTFLALSFGSADDAQTAQEIIDAMKCQGRTSIVAYAGQIDNFLCQIQRCEAVVATRLHALITSLLLRKPVAAVCYEAKLHHILDDIGDTGYRIPYGASFDPEKVLDCLSHRTYDSEKLAELEKGSQEIFREFDTWASCNHVAHKRYDIRIPVVCSEYQEAQVQLEQCRAQTVQLQDTFNQKMAEIQAEKLALAADAQAEKLALAADAQAEKQEFQVQLEQHTSRISELQSQLTQTNAAHQKELSQKASELESLRKKLSRVEEENKLREESINRTWAYATAINNKRSYKLRCLVKRFVRLFLLGKWSEKRYFLSLCKACLLTPEHGRAFVRNDGHNMVMNIANQLVLPSIAEEEEPVETCGVISPDSITGITADCLEEKYDKPDIIMFSVINYDFRFQRPQHFAKRFAENGHRVFYINANFVNPESIKEIEPGLFVVDFMTTNCNAIYFNDQWSGFDSWLHQKMDALVKRYAIRDAIVIQDYPNWIDCAEYLRDSYGFKLVVDYMDDAMGFLGTTTDTLRDNCIRMLKNSDLIVPSSQFLSDIAKEYNDNLVIIRNGTEVDHFRPAKDRVSENKRPVVGYYGAVAHWFAWEKVCYLAEHLPECDIVIIGAVTEYQDKLEKYSNVKLLGEMNYQDLPKHLAYFDVCLIPFDTSTDLIKATNPVKFYEYLSAGKRVVATEIPELEPFKDRYVYMSNDDEQFLQYVKLCLDGKDTLASVEDCIAFAGENDWQSRYEALVVSCENAVPMVSIVVLTYNNLKLNQYCIDSILNQTAYPNYELIVVDNQSTDGTVEYLHELEKMNHPRLRIVFNPENSGFAGGNNLAISMAKGKYVVLLNNDTVVTRGWLTAMVKHMEADETCGMVGAVTNSIGNEQMIGARYKNLKELARFAYAYTQLHNNEKWLDVDRIPLFGTMIRKSLMDEHGALDADYKVGMFEDDDFAMLVKKAGYHFYAVEDCFIHHVNNASFKKLESKEYKQIFETNKARYEQKWNTTWTMPKYRTGVTMDINKDTMVEPVE